MAGQELRVLQWVRDGGGESVTSKLIRLESMTISDVHPLSGNTQEPMVSFSADAGQQ